jgi:hypothetical protein
MPKIQYLNMLRILHGKKNKLPEYLKDHGEEDTPLE